MKHEIHDDSIPAPVQELMKLFNEHLSSVVFPDVSQQILESLAAVVQAKTKELEEALTRAESAREALDASRSELVQKSMRGLAYAKIFAEGNDELQEKLSGINLGKAGREKRAARGKSEEPAAVPPSPPVEEEKPVEKKPGRSSRKSGESKTKDGEAPAA